MNNLPQVSKQTRNNWWVDLFLFTSGIVSALSGIYFLFLPTGGYKGGANPFYNIRILFLRATWEDMHAWGGRGHDRDRRCCTSPCTGPGSST